MASPTVGNILAQLPDTSLNEVFENIAVGQRVRIERIISGGQATAAEKWYDQDEHEWVLVLSGAARLVFEDQGADGVLSWREVELAAGDYLNIPAHCRHRVSWTDPMRQTVWLAVFYR